MDPVSKFSDFEQLMDSGFGETTDIAFFKLCYVDIVAGTDIDSVFRMYREMVIRLKRKYPRVILLHVTVPVVRDYGRTIGILRKIAGRTNGRKEDNDARGRFSAWIDKEYGGDGSVFDLASWESGVIPGGMVVPASLKRFGGPLLPEYTDDGSHLNAKGRNVVAKGLIATLTGPLH